MLLLEKTEAANIFAQHRNFKITPTTGYHGSFSGHTFGAFSATARPGGAGSAS